MHGILDWGVNVILWLQRFHPALDLPFKAFTFLGEEEFLIMFIPFVFWSLDRRSGARLAFLFLLSAFASAVVKVVTAVPRPFVYDARVQKLFEVSGNSFPSHHTQSTVVVWGYLAIAFKRAWLWILAGILLVFVPLSRMYLGMHYPTDLLGGYALGALLLFVYLWLEPKFEDVLANWPMAVQLGLAILVPALLFAAFPINDEMAITSLAVLAGIGIGLVFERRWVRFASEGTLLQRVLRFVIGGIVLMALRFGLKAAFASLEPEALFRFVRYGLMGVCVGWLLPWAFVGLKLAGRREVKGKAASVKAGAAS